MIDNIYQIVKTILNKELRGNVSPAEFNLLAKQVQDEIFRDYFNESNLEKNKQNRGLINKNLANLPYLQRQKTNQFHALDTLIYNLSTTRFDLPSNIYYIKDRGLDYNGKVIDETQTADYSFMNSTMAGPSTTFPVYEMYSDSVKVYPETITENVSCRYLRKPLAPKWTYTVVSNTEMFDNTKGDFQDFELHESELPNIVIQMLSYFGINLRETEVAQYAEALKKEVEIKKQQ